MESTHNNSNLETNLLATVNGVASGSLQIQDRGASYGQGLFETMLYNSGTVPLWQRHRDRLLADSAVLGIPVSDQLLADNLSALVAILKQQSIANGVIKITVTAGSGGRGYASPETVIPEVICQLWPLPENLLRDRQQGVELRQCDYRLPINPVLAGIKHLNRLDQVLARREWGSEYYDAVMYDQHNRLVETTCANIFVKTAEGWATPLLDQAGVRGVMRGLLLEELFIQSGISVTETEIGRDQLASAGEIFICSSIRGVIPVIKIDQIGDWSIGTDTRQLQLALADYCSGYPC